MSTVNGRLAAELHLRSHLAGLRQLARSVERLDAWGERLAAVLLGGGRLLVCGNGGSAAEAEHLAAELVGRYRESRRPLSAMALSADGRSLSAIANDFGWSQGMARQVRAHGRRGDVLIALSTSGESANVLEAVRAARETGMATWGLSGPIPNPLHRLCDEALAFPGAAPAIQEMHLVAIHLLCEVLDSEVTRIDGS